MAQQQAMRAINILPREYRQPLITWREVALLLVVLLAGAVFYLMAQSYQEEQRATAGLQLEKDQTAAQLRAAQPRIDEANKLNADIEALRKELGQAQSTTEVITGKTANWDGLLTELFDKAPPGMDLTAVYQQEGDLVVEGSTSQPFSVLASFVRQISGNPEVRQVVVTRMESGGEPGGRTVFTLNLTLVDG
jgi:Tfp pilus assembly protein PilN